MENELNRLIELQNQEYEKQMVGKDDDLESSMDIDEFENKLKMGKSRMGFDDDSDSDDERPSSKMSQKKANITSYQAPKKTGSLLNDDTDLIKMVQEMHQNKMKNANAQPLQQKSTKTLELEKEINKYKQEAIPKTEEEKINDILISNNQSLKDKKLKELIQKNKELYVSYEKEKTMRQKLQKEFDKIKEETELQIAAMEGKIIPKSGNKTEDNTDWRKKYNDLEKKLQEVKLQNTTLKNDLNKATRIISKEIGENFNIDQVLMSENSWKGRAQQIEVLKARVKELQAKVGSSQNLSELSIISEVQTGFGADSRSSTSKSFAGSGKRREELESLKLQCEALKAENDALNDKVKALSSRKNIVEKELKEIRNETERNKAILLEKSDNDDKYIGALKREIEKLKSVSPGGVQTRIVYRDRPVEQKRSEADELEENLTRKEMAVLRNELEKKEKIIKELIADKVRGPIGSLNKENVEKASTTSENFAGGASDQEKIIKLETMIKILKQENEELSNLKLGVKTNNPDSKIIKDLSLQNAQLRRKLDDLQSKLKS